MDKINGIKAITFDADGTLWDFEKSMMIALQMILTDIKKYYPACSRSLDVEKLIEIRKNVLKEQEGKLSDLVEIRRMAFQKTLEIIGNPDEILSRHLTEKYTQYRYSVLEPYDDVKSTLLALKERYVLGIVSNGHTSPVYAGLGEFFIFTISPQDYGIKKPDPRIFHHALKEAQCMPSELIHVGDSLDDDIAGARAAGIRCAWLNRKSVKNTTDIIPDYEIASLDGLLDLL